MRLLIKDATLVNEGKSFRGSVVLENGLISDILQDNFISDSEHFDKVVDASGCYVLPGVIDDHVHFVSQALRQRPT